jgi:hypothetical protein
VATISAKGKGALHPIKWRKEAREQGRCLPNAGDGGAATWSSQDKFAAVLETASMNAEETAQYCRRRGVFAEQILAWRHDCEQAASLSQHERHHEALDAKAQRQRIRELERGGCQGFCRRLRIHETTSMGARWKIECDIRLKYSVQCAKCGRRTSPWG